MDTSKPFTLAKMLWSMRWWLLVLVIVFAIGAVTESQDIEPVFKLQWDTVSGWHYPEEFADHPNSVTTIACELDSGIVLVSPWYSDTQVAKLLLWYGIIPDWRNAGDRNPHPDEYWVIDYKQVERLCSGNQ